MPRVSVMQGRLSPPQNNRLQFFPTDWQAEFALARDLGFSGITWCLDRAIEGMDPILDYWGDGDVRAQIDEMRAMLPIHSIDCDGYPLFGDRAHDSLENFKALMPTLSHRLESSIMCIPLLEKAAPMSEHALQETSESLREIIAIAEPLELKIALETEMPARELAAFVDSFDSPRLGVCYDIGNATSYGFDCAADIAMLGRRIIEVHCKDRKRGSTLSVELGTGDADFPACFRALKAINYAGGFTMQAWRGDDYLQDARRQLSFIRDAFIQTYGS